MKSYVFLGVIVWVLAGLALTAGPVAAQDPLTTNFTYQGQLRRGGSPVNDTCDFWFDLYNDSPGGSWLASNSRPGVAVSDGLFNVTLGFDSQYFQGDRRWLRPWVTCPADGGTWTSLPRQELTAAPYALSLRPGAVISSSIDFNTPILTVGTSVSGGKVIYAQAYGDTSTAVYAEATHGNGKGVYGFSGGGQGLGVEGVANGFHGTGVTGEAFLTAKTGVRGYCAADGGYGVWGQGHASGTIAVYGQGEASNGYGGYFQNSVGGVALLARSNTVTDVVQVFGSSTTDIKFKVRSNGDVYADGDYYGAHYYVGSADFAEMVLPAGDGLGPGDVLAIGPDGRMVRSGQPYQRSVVGVYSTSPGFIGGYKVDEDGRPLEPGRIPLAVMGIVPVKASAENGPIQPGDLLTASATPGHAMRAGDDPPVGAVIGKALGALPRGTGAIDLLVMLQ